MSIKSTKKLLAPYSFEVLEASQEHLRLLMRIIVSRERDG
jgi:hypothetical protein